MSSGQGGHCGNVLCQAFLPLSSQLPAPACLYWFTRFLESSLLFTVSTTASGLKRKGLRLAHEHGSFIMEVIFKCF